MDRGPAALLLALTLTLLAGLMALAPSAEAAPLFVQNEALDRHLIFQDFSFFMPYESDQYRILGERAAALKRLGVSDIWFAPPYRAFDAAYREGYAVEDRYDLGQFPQGPGGTIPTKYGTAAELEAAIASVHGQGIRAEADLVPNQLIGLSTPEIVHATAVDQYGNPTEPGFQDRLAEAYSRGGGMGQRAYGLIKEWDAELLAAFDVPPAVLPRIVPNPLVPAAEMADKPPAPDMLEYKLLPSLINFWGSWKFCIRICPLTMVVLSESTTLTLPWLSIE